MNEPNVGKTIRQIMTQTQPCSALYICVNQPDNFKFDPEKNAVFLQNQRTIVEIWNTFCNRSDIPPIYILDKSTVGWDEKHHGVGWARKTLMDAINQIADYEDIIVSLDADTDYPPTYFERLQQIFESEKKYVAVSNPYYHKLIGKEAEDRAVLRYEIYMRCYELNLRRIRSPYAFTALGSAMAVRVEAYRKIGGIAPKKSGEDFYFLQQLSKIGLVSTSNSVAVYPATRLSDRVFFGTGPALIKGIAGDWKSYPIYSPKLWDEIAEIYQSFEQTSKSTNQQFLSPEDFQKFRTNSKTDAQFMKFCHEKFDGLRILQYLKARHAENPQKDEIALRENFWTLDIPMALPADFSFQNSPVNLLEEIRKRLFEKAEEK